MASPLIPLSSHDTRAQRRHPARRPLVKSWIRAILNVARLSAFSSAYTIREHNRDIRHIDNTWPCILEED
jgi:hypothetical protein